jgi:hypothetical protein
MRRRGKVILGIVFVGVVSITAFEVQRRLSAPVDFEFVTRPTANKEAVVTTLDPEALVRQYREPEELKRLCAEVTKANSAMDERHRSLSHLESHRAVEYDKQGKEIKDDRSWDRVWYRGTREYRQALKRVESVDGTATFEPAAPIKRADEVKVCFPFTPEATEGTYRFTLEGHEILGDQLTLVVRFDPNPPLDNRFRGKIWIDPDTFNPVRVEAQVAKNPPFVDKVSMTFEYGRVETGEVQAKRSVIGGSGGFAIVHKSYAVFTELSDFRPLDSKELATTAGDKQKANAGNAEKRAQ